jgi:hypothetical protein
MSAVRDQIRVVHSPIDAIAPFDAQAVATVCGLNVTVGEKMVVPLTVTCV